MSEVKVSKNFFLTIDEVELLLGCTIDPVLRAHFHRAKSSADGDFCLLTLTASELHEVYALLSELLTAEGLNDDGFFNATGSKVDAIMVVLEAQITSEQGNGAALAMMQPDLLAAE